MLRSPDSIPEGDVIIEDPIMEPFFITKPKVGGYVVYERVIKGKNDNKYLKTICYPANFNYALKTVCKELLHSKKTQYNTVKEYIKEWEVIQKKMNTITDID